MVGGSCKTCFRCRVLEILIQIPSVVGLGKEDPHAAEDSSVLAGCH
jgi:hypothetical protein